MITIVAAITSKDAIGLNGKLIHYDKQDMAEFKKITRGNTVVMGYKTFLSLGCKPLPFRKNIVISKNHKIADKNVKVFKSLFAVYIYMLLRPFTIFNIIGGESLYNYFIKKASVLFLTKFSIDKDGDKHFPTPKVNDTYYLRDIRYINDLANLYVYFKRN